MLVLGWARRPWPPVLRLPRPDPADTMGAMDNATGTPDPTPDASGAAAPATTAPPGTGRPRTGATGATRVTGTTKPTRAAGPTKPTGAAGPTKATRATKAVKAVKAAKPATAAKTSAPAERSTARSTSGPGPRNSRGTVSRRAPESAAGPGGGSWRGRSRNRSLYNRRLQRANERWPLTAQAMAGVLRRPELVLAALGGSASAPIQRDGRVLHRGVQAIMLLADRFGPGEASLASPEGPDVEIMRSQLRRMAPAVMPVRTDVHVSGRTIQGSGGTPDIPVRVYRQYGAGLAAGPDGQSSLPAIVYFHGGGWVVGDLDSHDASCRMLAAVSRCLVVAVDYRLAPEHPYPAAVDDAVAAYRWVQLHHEELGTASGLVGVMGDSAGGNLAAVVAQRTRAGAEGSSSDATDSSDVPPPVAQGLIYPALDARLQSDSVASMGEGLFLTRTNMEYYRSQYLPRQSDWESPGASPLLADDLRGLAPALVVTAGFDPLRDDGWAYATALRAAGVEVEYRCYDDQTHGFMGMGILDDSLASATEVCDAMGRMMRRASRSRELSGD
jgi:acetyl esterase